MVTPESEQFSRNSTSKLTHVGELAIAIGQAMGVYPNQRSRDPARDLSLLSQKLGLEWGVSAPNLLHTHSFLPLIVSSSRHPPCAGELLHLIQLGWSVLKFFDDDYCQNTSVPHTFDQQWFILSS